MQQLEVSKAGDLQSVLADPDFAGVELRAGSCVIGVVLSAQQLAGMQATQSLLSTNGALAAIAEGIADLAAGRAEDWRRLRTDYGRGDPDADPAGGPAGTVVSHRARWDLDLLAPPAAAKCFDLLDGWDASAVGLPLTAAFTELWVLMRDGYRMVYQRHRTSQAAGLSAIEVVHVDTLAS